MTTVTATIEIETPDGGKIKRVHTDTIDSPLLDLALAEAGAEWNGETSREADEVSDLQATKDANREDFNAYRRAKTKGEKDAARPGYNAYRRAHEELRRLGALA